MTVRWPTPTWWTRVWFVSAFVIAMVSGSVGLALGVLAVLTAWFVRGARVRMWGGGFRPIRRLELLDFAAVDELDAFDREQAAQAARR